ncbi:MAG: hypothetical protein LDL41_24005 [Coleofasciculus sp. S288]|nr:hypothetical protein [Coleofasciculus sp. S288]
MENLRSIVDLFLDSTECQPPYKTGGDGEGAIALGKEDTEQQSGHL